MTAPANPADEAVIKHMVNRFLAWRLPDTFSPDGGVRFSPPINLKATHWPTGTNLLDATQAEAMVRHMLEGLPLPAVTVDALEEARAIVARRGVGNCTRGMVDPGTGTFECRKLDRGECNCHEFDEAAEEIATLSAQPLLAATAFNEQARSIVEGIDADWVYDGQFAADGIKAQTDAVNAIKTALLAAESVAYARARRDSATDIAELRAALSKARGEDEEYADTLIKTSDVVIP